MPGFQRKEVPRIVTECSPNELSDLDEIINIDKIGTTLVGKESLLPHGKDITRTFPINPEHEDKIGYLNFMAENSRLKVNRRYGNSKSKRIVWTWS